jgi:hypothetical protein
MASQSRSEMGARGPVFWLSGSVRRLWAVKLGHAPRCPLASLRVNTWNVSFLTDPPRLVSSLGTKAVGSGRGSAGNSIHFSISQFYKVCFAFSDIRPFPFSE